MYIKSLLASILLLTWATLQVDGRRYVWTDENQTLHQGAVELESYTEFFQIDTDSGRVQLRYGCRVSLHR